MQPLQFNTAFYDPKAREGIDFLLTKGFLSVADPLDYLALGPVPDGQFNWIAWDDAKTADLIAKARQTTDATQRAGYIVQAQARYEAVAWSVPLLSINEVTYLNKRVTGAPSPPPRSSSPRSPSSARRSRRRGCAPPYGPCWAPC